MLLNLIHVIDDLRNLAGEVATVQAIEFSSVRGYAVEDTAAVLLCFANGALGTIPLSDTIAAPWSWEMTCGEDKTFPTTGRALLLHRRDRGVAHGATAPSLALRRHERLDGPISRDRRVAPRQDTLARQLRHFCAVARGQERPLIDAREGTRTLAITLAVKESARSGTTVRL